MKIFLLIYTISMFSCWGYYDLIPSLITYDIGKYRESGDSLPVITAKISFFITIISIMPAINTFLAFMLFVGRFLVFLKILTPIRNSNKYIYMMISKELKKR